MSVGLGYGCSGLMGGLTRSASLRLLNAAYDGGVRYFDVARSYGYGEAELVLGEFLAGRRDNVEITTKVGFLPSRSSVVAFARSAVRPFASIVPALKRALRRKATTALISKPALTPEFISESVEASLKALRCDFVDNLLLHEADVDDWRRDDLYSSLEILVAQGKVRRYGIGSDLERTGAILAAKHRFVPLIQFENNPVVKSMQRFDLQEVGTVNTHRAVGNCLDIVEKYVHAHPLDLASWKERLGIDISSRRELSAMLIAYSVRENSRGRVLFSSRDSARIRENIRAAEGASRFEDSQLHALEEMFASASKRLER